jgi:cadmium resistance transport/sequestration family protein
MIWVVETMLAGVTAFAATNVDDIVILTLLFVRANSASQRQHIVTGQYLGFLVLIAASLPGLLGGLLIPKIWLGWLGLLPIAIGLHQFLQPAAESVQTTTPAQSNSETLSTWQSRLVSVLSPQTYQVAAVTIANGGDNIAIYVPLFANSSLPEFVILLNVFLVMIALWCMIAHQLAKHPLLSQSLARYGHRIVPFVLIGLGLFIVLDSGSYRMLMR